MKRLWLIWNDSEATGVWEGMIWNVRLLGEFDIDDALTVWLERLDPVIDCKTMSGFDWDRDHGDRPEWVDCIWGKEEARPSSGAVDVGHAAVEFFRNEIREHGFMRQIFPPEPVTTVAEGRARWMVDMAGSWDDLLQGVRRMQEAGRAAEWASEASGLMPLHMYGPF